MAAGDIERPVSAIRQALEKAGGQAERHPLIERVENGEPITSAVARELADITDQPANYWRDVGRADEAHRADALLMVNGRRRDRDPAAFARYLCDTLERCYDDKRRPPAGLLRRLGPVLNDVLKHLKHNNTELASQALLRGFHLKGTQGPTGPESVEVVRFMADEIQNGESFAKAKESAAAHFKITARTAVNNWNTFFQR